VTVPNRLMVCPNGCDIYWGPRFENTTCRDGSINTGQYCHIDTWA